MYSMDTRLIDVWFVLNSVSIGGGEGYSVMGDVSITISFPAEYDTEVFYCDFDGMGVSAIIGLGEGCGWSGLVREVMLDVRFCN